MGTLALADKLQIENRCNDSFLVARARKRDNNAFEDLYHRHVGHVYGLCLRMTGNHNEAEDLTQETFVRAWNKLDTFREASAFGTWLHRVTVNTVLTSFKKNGRYTQAMADVTTETARTASIRSDTTAHKLDLDDAIAQLPIGARTVFVLHDVEGHRHVDIAEMMGIEVGTSKAHLHRARKLLREILK